MKVKYQVSLVQTGDNSFTVEGITKNAAVNQFIRKTSQVNKRKFARKLKGSTLIVK